MKWHMNPNREDTRARRKSRVRSFWPGPVTALALVIGLIAAPAAAQKNGTRSKVTDQHIADAVEDGFILDPAVLSYQIDTTAAEGIVTLTGTVDNILAKERAADLAMMIKGVRGVVNRISVKPAPNVSDNKLARDVDNALLDDPATESYEVEVVANDGMITLKGQVDSWQERTLAETVAKSVHGVKDITNKLIVEYGVERIDSEIAAEIKRALYWDKWIDDAMVTVNVKDGVVTMSGTVGSAIEKSRALSRGWVAGVANVRGEQLKVARWARDEDLREKKFSYKPDDEIRTAIKDALLYDPRVSMFNVRCEMWYGTVTLRGTVDNLKAKRAAEADAKNIVGVRRVINRLKVRPTDERTAGQIESDVREALTRSPWVNHENIDVKLRGDNAVLTGTVNTYLQQWKAEDAVSRVNGVAHVDNRLAVSRDEPYAFNPYIDDPFPFGLDWHDFGQRYTTKRDEDIRSDVNSRLFWSPFVDQEDVKVSVDDGQVRLTGTVGTHAEFTAAEASAYRAGATWVDNDLKIKENGQKDDVRS